MIKINDHIAKDLRKADFGHAIYAILNTKGNIFGEQLTKFQSEEKDNGDW